MMNIRISEIPESSLELFQDGAIKTAKELYPGQDFLLVYMSTAGVCVTNHEVISKIRPSADQRILNEHDVLKELSKKELKFQVPQIVNFGRSKFGCTYLTTKYIPGKTLDEMMRSKVTTAEFIGNLWNSLIEAREQISTLFETCNKSCNIKHHEPSREYYISRLEDKCKYRPNLLSKEDLEEIREILRGLDYKDLKLQFCHNDLSPDNIIVDKSGNLTSIIDWEDSRICSPIYEEVTIRNCSGDFIMSRLPFPNTSTMTSPVYLFELLMIAYVHNTDSFVRDISRTLISKYRSAA